MNTKRPSTTLTNQQGMVSITVTVVFIMVISLVVLGFSQVTRRNSRESLDRQLSSQAFYAAETGINDAVREITRQVNRGEAIKKQDTCNGAPYAKNDGKFDTGNPDVSYTCLTVNPLPPTLDYSNVGETSLAIPLNAANEDGTPTVLNSIVVSWKRTAGNENSTKPQTCPQPRIDGGGQLITNFPTATKWSDRCPFGVLRVDIVPTDTENLSDPIVAARNTLSAFIYPKAGGDGDVITYDKGSQNGMTSTAQGAPQGLVKAGGCDDETCKFTINGLNFANAYMRVRTVYLDARSVSVKVGDATIEEAGGVVERVYLTDAQIIVDSTGKSQDVLRRLQVRVPYKGTSSRPINKAFSDYALQTDDSICKRFVVSPTYGSDPGCSVN